MSCLPIIENALKTGRENLTELEAYEICGEYHIPYPPTLFAENWQQLASKVKCLGYPVVLKIVSPAIIHKSEIGGVITGINCGAELETAFYRLHNNIREKAGDVPVQGVLAQKAMPQGVELVVGGIRNAQFGPVIMFGLGGIMIEVIQDVSFRLAPLNQSEALRQIMETKAYQVLKGIRGTKACDIAAVAGLIVKVGNLLAETPQIQELDLNPVIAYPDGCIAVDARIIVK
jgi:acyl-CoA synthetase (NDP forming)